MHYGPVKALQNASFSVEKGEIVGLVGPNGAGKSTTMKILTTYLYPSDGTASVCGFDVKNRAIDVRQHIGYLPEVLPLYKDMEVKTYLDFVGRARGLEGNRLKERTEWVIEKCGIRPMYRKLISALSKGYKQRTGIAQALIHDPDVIILDEPTSGLDPHQILEVRALINELAKEKTLLLSTHILQEVEATAEKIIVINRGQIVGNGTIIELRDRVQKTTRSRIAVNNSAKDVKGAITSLDQICNVEQIDKNKTHTTFEVRAEKGSVPMIKLGKLAKEKGWELSELEDMPFTLEETFLALTEKSMHKHGKRKDENENSGAKETKNESNGNEDKEGKENQ